MDVSHLLTFCLYWLATIAGTGNVPIGFDGDVLDAIAGETRLVKIWADNRRLTSITISKDNAIRLNAIVIESKVTISKDPYGVILLQYNNATRETSLILENCSKEDEGIYNVDEMVADPIPDAFERKAGKWNFKLNVIEPSEVEECDVGGIFKMKLRNLSTLHSLFYYDQIVVANILLCEIAIHSHLHGRLRCIRDGNKHVINIKNVTQRDIGLYTVAKTSNGSNNGSKRYYLNVTDHATNAIIGDNVTIDWFYRQQAINRTLRMIHSKNGIMMNLQPNNKPKIVPAFRKRILYNGDVSRGYMSFTLLNIDKSDSGVYKIETLHGNTVSGCKHLIVQGNTTDSRSTRGPYKVTLAEIMDAEVYTTSPSLTVQLTSPDNHCITCGSPTSNEVTESTPALTKDSSSTRGPSLVPSAEILDTEEYTTSLSLSVRLTSPANDRNTSSLLVHVMYVVIGAMGLIIMMIGCLIWIQRSNRYSLKAVQELVLATSSSTLNSAPSAIRKQLPTAIVNEGELCRLIRSTPVGNAQSALKYRSNPDNSPSCDTQSNFEMSVPILEDGEPDCPTVYISGSAASNTAVDLSQSDQFPYFPYARVKKGPRSTFTNNKKDNTRNNYVRDSKNDDGYETCGNIKRMSCMEHVKVSEDEGAVISKDQEPKNCTTPHGEMHSDYADIYI